MSPFRARFLWQSVPVFACVLLTACGSVGEPLPPLLHIPGRVEDFTVRQEVGELNAEWTWPVLGSEGQVFREMDRFEVYALYIPPGGAAPGADAFEEFGQVLKIVPTRDADARGPGSRLAIRASLEDRFGTRVGFTVRGVSRRGKAADWSELALLNVVQPPDPPAGLEARTLEQGVQLRWEAVEGAADYAVERRSSSGGFDVVAQVAATEFLDIDAGWDGVLTYRVRARAAAADSPLAPGDASTQVEITPTDVFAPAAPSDLRALVAEDGVELSWASNTEPDLAGYRVRRAGAVIHEGLIHAANYTDKPLSPGEAVIYRVTAVDLSGNESAASEASANALR